MKQLNAERFQQTSFPQDAQDLLLSVGLCSPCTWSWRMTEWQEIYNEVHHGAKGQSKRVDGKVQFWVL